MFPHIRSTVIRQINATDVVKYDPVFGGLYRVTLTPPQMPTEEELVNNVARLSYRTILAISQKLHEDVMGEQKFVPEYDYRPDTDALNQAIGIAENLSEFDLDNRWLELLSRKFELKASVPWKREGF